MNLDHIPDNDDKPLNDKEEAFVNAYMEWRSVPRAAKEVGVGTPTGYKWYDKAHVKKAIEQQQDENAVRANITNEWLLEQIKEIAVEAKQEKNWNAALKGFETLARIKGLFDTHENNGITYNIMQSVIMAPDQEAAVNFLEDKTSEPIEGKYEVMQFNIGEDA